ncbi:hypothetical protein [Bradyrhizobium sp. ERR14]|uniref:hypothetical protein n=1 Tax=Bradyrhizobium sp. ERR14 TaxID=2663837 RepID=UPI00160A34D5|nr:hypothetical protein [Bradyrhizobium sp. ERR14]MBB4395604.1 hypothetical protein [Bradyrhizobium sp. ERR14]
MADAKQPPPQTRVSQAKLDYHIKQLRKYFARADDRAFLQMIWAVDALQSDREAAAKTIMPSYPREAVVKSSLHSPHGVHRWELETLLIQLLLTPKEERRAEGNLVLDCSKFDAMRGTINRLRALENVESGRYLGSGLNIFGEMHRIAQRQFHWQHGYLNMPNLYRYIYIYGQGKCAQFFNEAYGVSINDFTYAGFAMYAAAVRTPWLRQEFAVSGLGITPGDVQKVLNLMTLSLEQAKAEERLLTHEINRLHGAPIPTAFMPSILRRHPLISLTPDMTTFMPPIPELILMRISSGLYYDVIPGKQPLLNEANDRFEQYCHDLIDELTDFVTRRSHCYGPKGGQFDSPDVLVTEDDEVVIAIECKATRLTYLAQFAEDPFEAEKKQYMQLARGAFQLWRYFSHTRRGLSTDVLADEAYPMVVTLDSFFMMSPQLSASILAEANSLADDEGEILSEDRRHIIYCPIMMLEEVLQRGDRVTLLAALKAAGQEKYKGWMFREVFRAVTEDIELGSPQEFPFDLDPVLPWWQDVQKLGAEIKSPELD